MFDKSQNIIKKLLTNEGRYYIITIGNRISMYPKTASEQS